VIAGARAIETTAAPIWSDRRTGPRLLATLPTLVGAVILGLVLRLAALRTAGIEHPDEIFQYLEQTHRLLFGTGVVPWEYRYGIRGGLMPLLLAPPMALAHAVRPDAALWLGPRLLLTALSLAPIVAGWLIGRRWSPTHAASGALAMAVAPDLIHFAPHALAEPVAVALLLAGYALAGERSERRLVLAGLCLALGACVRFQYLPVTLLLTAPAWRAGAWRPLLLGAMAGLLLSAAADAVIGVAPFEWIVENLRYNLVAGRAALYGVSPPGAYLTAMFQLWGVWATPLIALAACAARRHWPLAAAAVLTLALHMMIGHKEFRFILLVTTLATLLAALGTADLIGRSNHQRHWSIAAAGLWLLASASIGLSGRAAALTPPSTSGGTLFGDVRRDVGACGIGLWRIHWTGTTGMTGLHRAIPVTIVDDEKDVVAAARAFDRLLAPEGSHVAGFRLRTCDGRGACLFERPGGCAPAPLAIPINRWLREHDQ
jgi:GPI mannosyltransferase 3